jgi:hypothetical protein
MPKPIFPASATALPKSPTPHEVQSSQDRAKELCELATEMIFKSWNRTLSEAEAAEDTEAYRLWIKMHLRQRAKEKIEQELFNMPGTQWGNA